MPRVERQAGVDHMLRCGGQRGEFRLARKLRRRVAVRTGVEFHRFGASA